MSDSYVELDGIRYPADEALLRVTRLPTELRLDASIECRGDRAPSLTICDQRVPANHLDGAVVERAIGDAPHPYEPTAVYPALGLYDQDHFTLYRNRLAFRQLDASRVELTWDAVTENLDCYIPGSPESVLHAVVRMRVEERELPRISWICSDRRAARSVTSEHLDVLIAEAKPRVIARGQELGRHGWFDGRPFFSIDLTVEIQPRADTPPRLDRVDAGVAYVRVGVPAAVLASGAAPATERLLVEIERATAMLAVAHPTAPSLLR